MNRRGNKFSYSPTETKNTKLGDVESRTGIFALIGFFVISQMNIAVVAVFPLKLNYKSDALCVQNHAHSK